jgi:hypothetical protein
MKLAILLALAACQSGGGDDFPVGGGGGGPIGIGGGNPGAGGDAGTGDAGDGDAGIPITGRVCVLSDLRKPSVCDDTKDASNLVLTLGAHAPVALTKLGEFSFAAELGTDLTWRVTGHLGTTADVTIVPTVMAYGTENIVPVITADDYTNELNNTHVLLADQEGSVVVRVVSGVKPAAGIGATTTRPTTNGETFYDGSAKLSWNPDTVTGVLGVVWFPDVPLANTPPTTALLGLVVPARATPVTASALVENGAITFVTKDIQ